MTKTTEQLVAELLDREAIRDLPARYCHYVWTKDIEAMLGIFTRDGLLSIDAGLGVGLGEYSGADALRAFFQGLDENLHPRPFIHNHVFELHGADRATGVCCLELRMGSQMDWAGAGFYDDDYVKDAGAWKFKARHFHGLAHVGATNGGH